MLSLKKKMLMSGARPIRPQDVFATSLYTGNGGTQTITNGLDLAGKGGLVWAKSRSAASNHNLTDTVRGTNTTLRSNATGAEFTGGQTVSAFGSNGFTLGNYVEGNGSGDSFAAWSFRRAKKFFDIVTYTGNGQSGRQIPHGLGDVPGMIVVKARSLGTDWIVQHRSISGYLNLNSTAAQDTTNPPRVTASSATSFTVSANNDVNANGVQYVAYLFAQNPDLIDCGSVTKGSGAPATKATGWPIQFLLLKNASTPGGWYLHDTRRGFAASGSNPFLTADTSNPEASAGLVNSTPTGFTIPAGLDAGTYVYLAIRSPT